jgi:hypothetical protein
LQPVCDDNFDFNGAFGLGAAWVFTRSNGVWTQQGAKLVGTKLGRRSGVGRRRVPGRTLGAMLKNRIPARLQVPQPVGGRTASRNALLATPGRIHWCLVSVQGLCVPPLTKRRSYSLSS